MELKLTHSNPFPYDELLAVIAKQFAIGENPQVIDFEIDGKQVTGQGWQLVVDNQRIHLVQVIEGEYGFTYQLLASSNIANWDIGNYSQVNG